MNRLALAFGIVCLLQGLSAVPEYGLGITIQNSVKVGEASTSISGQLTTIGAISLDPIASGYASLETASAQLTDIIDDVTTYSDPIFTGYATLVGAVDGDVNAAFLDFLTNIESAITYIGGATAGAYITALEGISYDGLADQLTDAFGRIGAGLAELKAAAANVEGKLASAFSEAGVPNVDLAILRKHLTLSDMYTLLRTANNLDAYIPLVQYILTTAKEHIKTGDDYMVNLQSDIDAESGTSSGEYLANVDEITTAIENDISGAFVTIFGEYGTIVGEVAALTHVTSATNIAALKTTIGSFETAFSPASYATAEGALTSDFNDIGSELATLISAMAADVVVADNELVQFLIDTLVGNLEYGEYCYEKYAYLVENLLTQGIEGGWQCVDKEYIRLQHLQATILLLIELLNFDFEYISDEVTVCDTVYQNAAAMNNCVDELNGFYTDLLTATEGKRDLIYDLASAEAVASKNRLLICFELTNIDVSVTQVAVLNSGLHICAADGPNGSD